MSEAKTHRTKTGLILTDEEIDALATEIEEIDYDVETLKGRRRGRLSIGSGPADVVPVRIDPELRAAVEARAEADQTTTSEIIREAVRRFLNVAKSGHTKTMTPAVDPRPNVYVVVSIVTASRPLALGPLLGRMRTKTARRRRETLRTVAPAFAQVKWYFSSINADRRWAPFALGPASQAGNADSNSVGATWLWPRPWKRIPREGRADSCEAIPTRMRPCLRCVVRLAVLSATLKVSDSTVGSNSVSMVHRLVGGQGSTEFDGHDMAMLLRGSPAVSQVTKLPRYWHDFVPMIQEAEALGRSCRLVGSQITAV